MRLTPARATACKLLPLLAFVVAGCGSENPATGPSAGPPELATTTLPSFVQVSVGDFHTCAVTAGGLIYCWGANLFGELGDGTTEGRLRPVRVHGGTLRFRRVVAGMRHTCAETTEGKAYCWGENLGGVLGIGYGLDEVHTPMPVAGGHTFRLINGMELHVCGVTPSDQLYCWGSNESGQLGRSPGPGAEDSVSWTPVLVPGSLKFRTVSAGGEHTCAVTTSSVAYCWGNNSKGQLGDSTTTTRSIPRPVYGGRKFKQVKAGSMHTCGITMVDRVACWGTSVHGELGDGRAVGRRLIPHAVGGGHLFQGLSTGQQDTCALDLSGRAFCWGWNKFGQLGDGTHTSRSAPVAVHSELTFKPMDTSFHTCGVAGGKVYCWGENAFGALGDGTEVDHSLPAPIVGGS
jgi:alpha-tubulin suppressor-like RCC1 family protein